MIFSYFVFNESDSNSSSPILKIVLPDETLSIPIETQFETLFDSDILRAPYIAISPDGNIVVTEVIRENSTVLIAINIQDSSSTPTVLTTLPENAYLSEIKFSPNGKWLYANYSTGTNAANHREYNGFMEIGSDVFQLNYECKDVIAFAPDDDVVYCRVGNNVGDIGKLYLTRNLMKKPFLDLPNFKLFSATKLNWNFKSLIPSLNAFVLEREDGKFFLVDQLETLGNLTFWYSDQVDVLINSHVIAKIPPGAYVFQFLLSPDGKQVAVTAINSRGLGGGIGIDRRTFTFVTPVDETYHPQDFSEPGSHFYPLGWSPDSKSLVGLSEDGKTLSIWDIATMSELQILHRNNEPPFFNYLNTTVRGVDVFWTSQPLTFDGQPYNTPTQSPTPTLESGASPTPISLPLQPVTDNLQIAAPIQEPDLTLFAEQGWKYNNATLDGSKVVVEGSGSWDAFFDYPEFDIVANTGVLVKFKFEHKPSGIIALTRGKWDTPSYRQWGVMRGANSMSPIISQGTNHSAQPEIIREIAVIPDTWYYLFLGIDENNDLIQLMWNPETPSNYQLGFYNYGDVDDEPYYFHVAGNTGEITIGEVVFYQFEKYNK